MFSIIIPSRNIENLTACVAAIRKAGETARVIVVWDDPTGGRLAAPFNCSWEPSAIIEGVQPFCFARAVNQGIRAAWRDDVILLNDDALLETCRGFSLMLECMDVRNGYGLLACSTNVTGYPAQQRRPADYQRALRELPTVAFVAVEIPRHTINTVGLLDERFGGPGVYGGEDVDYCIRVREAGLKVGVSDFCFVDHATLPSTFRAAHPRNSAPGDITESNRLGREKWGDKWPEFPR
jgi:GT2 family glycosyltransferase